MDSIKLKNEEARERERERERDCCLAFSPLDPSFINVENEKAADGATEEAANQCDQIGRFIGLWATF